MGRSIGCWVVVVAVVVLLQRWCCFKTSQAFSITRRVFPRFLREIPRELRLRGVRNV
jgi:hypothetical protein